MRVNRVFTNRVVLNLFLLLVLLQQNVVSYATNELAVKITTINEEKGLFTDDVRCVFQDDSELLWIGTDEGLFTYDGYRIVQINARNKDNSRHNIGFTKVVIQSDSSSIFVGTSSGLYKYSRVEGVLRLIPQTQNLEITDMVYGADGKVWLATYAGVYYYDSEDGVKRCEFYDAKGAIIYDIKCILFDSNRRLWFGTWSNGLFRYDPKSGAVVAFPKLGKMNSPHVLFEDQRKHLLVGTWGDGVYYFDVNASEKNVSYRNIRFRSNEYNNFPSNIIYSIGQDKQDDYLWIGGRNGLCVMKDIDQPESFVNVLGTRVLDGNMLSGKDVNSICVGKGNSMWLGILGGGVNRISFSPFKFTSQQVPVVESYSKLNYQVDKIIPITANKIWVSVPRSRLIEVDLKTNRQTVVKAGLGVLEEEVDGVTSYFRVAEQECIVCLSSGVVCRILFSKEGRVVKSTVLARNVGRVYSFAKGKDGAVFFSTKWQVGRILPSNEIQYLPQPLFNQMSPSLAISAIAIDSIGDLWIASINNRLIRLRQKSGLLDFNVVSSYYLMRGTVPVSGIYTLFVDSKNRMLVGTNGSGLFYFDTEEDLFKAFDDRLRNQAETIFDILEDGAGRYWINTIRGLMSLVVDNQFRMADLRKYDLSDGLPEAKVQRGSLSISSQGTLFCGHRKGFSYVNTASIVHENSSLVPSIIDIKVGNQSFEEFPLQEQLAMSDGGNPYFSRSIKLRYNQSNIGIELGVINHLKPRKVVYGYKLVGYSREWTYVSSINRDVVFPHLNSGHYKLLVKASENHVDWAEERVLMHIEVMPPWWSTWWAKLIYFVLLVGMGYAIVCVIRKKARMDRTLKMKEMERENVEILTHTKLQFFTNISHELLTPLTILSMMVEDLKSKYKGEDTNFNIMSINIERLIRLFQQILEFRKAETRNLKLKVRYADIAQFVRDNCYSNFHPLIQRNGIHFSIVCTPLQIEGYFDVDKMDKILYNLLSNAIKYTPKLGNVQVTVKANDDKSSVEVVVHDTGIGIAPENIPHIFNRFYDGEYRKMAVSGYGIGLSLTKELVALHKGTIRVDSQLGVGTDFTVVVPIGKDSFAEHELEEVIIVDEQEPTAQALKSERQASSGHLTPILLVDDNEDMLYSLQLLMEKSFNVYTATNGFEAIAVLETQEIELVISDVAMPEFDGISLCSKIKQELSFCHIPIILLTAKGAIQDKISGYDAGADAYITKPFNLLELQAQIYSILKSRSKFFDHFKAGAKLVVNQLDYTSLDEVFLCQAIDYVEKNISNEEIDFDLFASYLNVSRSVLYRKIKLLTSVSPNEFVRKIRLNTACRILCEKKVSISEVAFFVGFSNPKYFSTIFRKEFGCTPTEYVATHALKQ